MKLKLIRFSHDKNGKRLAHRRMETTWLFRWVRMNVEQAEAEIAAGVAVEVQR